MYCRDPDPYRFLLSLLLPGGGFVAKIAAAYIDESGTHEGAPILCVGGYLFADANAIKFNAEMQPVYDRYGIPYFHTNEIVGGKFKEDGKGAFDHLRDGERDKLCRTMIRSVKRRAAFGFASTINEDTYNKLATRYSELPTAYAFCLFQCFILIRHWICKEQFEGPIAYFLEDGAKHKADARRFIDSNILPDPVQRAMYRYHSLTELPKDACPAINAPDLISWHWYKFHCDRLKGRKTPRRDTTALIRPIDLVSDWTEASVADLEGLVAARELERLGLGGR